MTFTYDSTDISTDLAKVRTAIGDVYENQAYLTDEEINAVLAVFTSPDAAAMHCLDQVIARVLREPASRSAAGLSAQRRQMQALHDLRDILKSKLSTGGGGPQLVGPNSISDKDSSKSNTNREASAFARDAFTNKQS